MAQFPVLPFWTDAYIADTQHLTNEEHGVYLRLLMFAWRTAECGLPDDDRRLALMVGVTPKKWVALKAVVMKFWILENGLWTQKKLTGEREKVQRNLEQKRDAGFASSQAKALKKREVGSTAVLQPLPTAGVTATPTAGQLSISISNEEDKSSSILSEKASEKGKENRKVATYPESFESFWVSYPTNANMSKKEAYVAWKRLDEDDKEKCARAVSGYIAFLKSKPDHPVLHACRFISQRRFDGYTATPSPAVVDVDAWRKRLAYGRKQSTWFTEWGPAPGVAGCLVPAALIEAGDGNGWKPREVAA